MANPNNTAKPRPNATPPRSAHAPDAGSGPTEPVTDATDIPESEMAPARVDARRLEQSGPGAPGVRVTPPTRVPRNRPEEEDKPEPETPDEPEPADLPTIRTEPPGVEEPHAGAYLPRV
jgi:hypothetical protein